MLKESFLEYLFYERRYSEHTVCSYGLDLSKFEEYLKGVDEDLDLIHVDADLVRGWVVSLMEQGYTSTSVNRKLSSLRSFYRYLLRKNMIPVDPMLKVIGPKKKKPLPVFVKEAEMDRLLDDADFGDGFLGVRDRMILEVFYETGVRRSELIDLNDADVDFSSCVIKVTGKRNKQRLIPFGEELERDLRVYLSVRDENISERENDAFFVRKDGRRLSPGMVYLLVKRNLTKVVTLKKKSPHVLRHTFATSMLNHQAELEAVKELLGHESLSTTEVYTHTTFEELKKVYEQAHPRA
ncbi:tyrosine recombinase XerC [Phocaeicola coprophilus]|uniref:tyrosine recombinase XerC n=1 Tax=Phocaeicola coprophilus TaxID=387090 RepID=UPI0022E35FAD|nr:tyrosine recombinase XerC [Phocaeicola coprophilus]